MTTTKVNSEFIAVNAISGTIIADGAITSTHLAVNSVDSSELVTGSIDTIHIAANQVTATKIVSDGLEHRHMHSNVISGLSAVTAVGGDYVLIGDTSDSNNLKKALISDFGVAGISSSADATAITIDSSERIGIGETSPDEALVINGGVKIKSTNYLSFTNTSDQTYIHAAASNVLAFGTDSTERLRIASNGDLQLMGGNQMTNALSWYNTASYELASIENVSHSSYNDSGGLLFKTAGLSNSGMAERLRIDSDGKVGIGTTNPGGSSSTKLHLMSTTTSSPTVANDADEFIIEGAGHSGMTFLSTSSSNIRFGDAADSSVGIISYSHSANSLTFGTNNSTAMTIASSSDITMSGTGSMTIPSGTTAQRPASPTAGMVRYNTTLDYVEYYNGDGWFATDTTGVAASGGTETTVGGYRIHTFTSSGTFTVTSGGAIEYLVIAGGGGGGSGTAGGGGAGGYRTNVSGATSGGGASAEGTFNATVQNYTITVGAGGAGGVVSSSNPASGSNSVFGSVTSLGGGAGGEGNPNNTMTNGLNGGSGGGSWTYSSNSGTAGSGTTGQGYAGGSNPANGGSGGGGAGAVGVAGSTGNPDGGAGVSSSITGSAVVRGGGGGGGKNPTAGAGGSGGGGAGDPTAGNVGSGTANTGGGGGGGYTHASGNGGNGGSGIVIIRYEV